LLKLINMKNKLLLATNFILLLLILFLTNYISINYSEIKASYFSIFGLILMVLIYTLSDSFRDNITFLKSLKSEFKMITWSTRKETITLMNKIMLVTLISGILVVFMDKIISLVINGYLL
jgi:preprotein translocase SecE subunit